MRQYELVMVISPETNEEEASELVGRVGKFITDNGGVVKNQENWGTKKLAYPIGHYREGNYVMSEFNSEPSTANELEKLLRASQQLIRYLVIKQDEKVEEDSEIKVEEDSEIKVEEDSEIKVEEDSEIKVEEDSEI